MKSIIAHIIMISFFVSLSESSTITEYDNDLLFLKQKIEKNYYLADEGVYEGILIKLDSLNLLYQNEWRIEYYCGFVQIQIGKINRETKSNKAVINFKRSLNHLNKADSLKPDAEIKILLSSVYGKLASVYFLKAWYYGSLSEKYLDKALESSKMKEDPKLNLVAATHLMFTPQIFGGDKDQAEKLLMAGLNFGLKSENFWLIKWAEKAEFYAYLSQLEIEQDNYNKALFYIKSALKIQPAYSFILNELIPEIEKNKGSNNEG